MHERVPEPAWPPGPPPAAAPRPWSASGPAVVRATAATVLLPVLCAGTAWLAQPVFDDRTLAENSDITGGYLVGAAVALVAQALLILSLVDVVRRRVVTDRGALNVAIAAGATVLGASALVLVTVFLAIFAFIGSLVLSVVVAPAALVLCVVVLIAAAQAHAAGREPGSAAMTCLQVAGWGVAIAVMPFAAGCLVLSAATIL